MSDVEKSSIDVQVEDTIKRIEELHKNRTELTSLNEELVLRESDLKKTETVYGTDSKEYDVQKNHVSNVKSRIDDVNKKIADLTYKRSELKPILDELTKKFEVAIKSETSKEYHIEMASTNDEHKGNGKKVFKNLLEYLYHNVRFTPKTAVNLMVLVRNMEENKAWVNSKDFDNVIILRSASVLSLWRFIMEDMEGKGFYEARNFLECWANCGQSISDTVRLIQKENAESRKIGSDLNIVEEEFNRSENDIPESESLTTKDEVAPEVGD